MPNPQSSLHHPLTTMPYTPVDPVDQALMAHVAERDTDTVESLIQEDLPLELMDLCALQIPTKRLHPDAELPTYATDGSGAFDFYAAATGAPRTATPAVIGTGIAVEIPYGYVMLLFSRSGHAFKHDTRLSNCVGVIDADYRGEIKVKLAADQPNNLLIKPGDRIAQGIVIPVPQIEFVETDTLSETSRGDGGFGSTGA